jgi:hypothetical protein
MSNKEKRSSYNKIVVRAMTAQKKTRKLADLIEEDARKNKEAYEKPLTKDFATSVQKAAFELSKVHNRSFVIENVELLYNRSIKKIAAANGIEKVPKRKRPVPEEKKLEIKAALSRGVTIQKIQHLFPEFSTQSLNKLLVEIKNGRDEEKKKMCKVRRKIS